MGAANSMIVCRNDLKSLSAADIAAIVQSLGKAYTPIGQSIIDYDLTGELIYDALENEETLQEYLETIGATQAIPRNSLKKKLSQLVVGDAPLALTSVDVKVEDKGHSAVDFASLTEDQTVLLLMLACRGLLPKYLQLLFTQRWEAKDSRRWDGTVSGKLCYYGSHVKKCEGIVPFTKLSILCTVI